MEIFDFASGKRISSKMALKDKTKFQEQLKQQKLEQQFNVGLVYLWLKSLSDQDLTELERTVEVTGERNSKNYIKFIHEKFLEKLSNFIFSGNANNSGFSFMNKQQFDTLVLLAESGICTNVSKREKILYFNNTVKGLKIMRDRYSNLRKDCDADIREHQQELKTKEAYVKVNNYYSHSTYNVLGEVRWSTNKIKNILKNWNNSQSHVNSYKVSDIYIDLQNAINRTKFTKNEAAALKLWLNGKTFEDKAKDKHLSEVVTRACTKIYKTLGE